MTARNIFIDTARGDAAQWRLSTNSRGFRTPEFETSKDPGTLRVIVLGDSNSMGWLLDDEKTYPRRLEYYLGDLMERPVEVLNLAGGGYTSFSTLQLWRQEVLALNPDLIIVSCGANDGQRMQSTDEQYAAIFSGASGWLTYQLGRLKLTALLHRLRTERKAPPVPRVSPAKYGKNLALIAGEARDLGVPVVFFKVCCCRGAYQEELEKIVASFQMSLVVARKAIAANFSKPALRQSRAALIDEIFNWYTAGEREANPSLLFYFRDRCHMNPLGADLAAIGLAATVQKQLDKR
jgi:lysophospholipase L1-like esterase